MKFINMIEEMVPAEAEHDNNNNDDEKFTFSERPNLPENNLFDTIHGKTYESDCESDMSWKENFVLQLSDDFEKTISDEFHKEDTQEEIKKNVSEAIDHKNISVPNFPNEIIGLECNNIDRQIVKNDNLTEKTLKKNLSKSKTSPNQRKLSEYFTVENKSLDEQTTTSPGKINDNDMETMIVLEKLMRQLFTAKVILTKLPQTTTKTISFPQHKISSEDVTSDHDDYNIKSKKMTIPLPKLVPLAIFPIDNISSIPSGEMPIDKKSSDIDNEIEKTTGRKIRLSKLATRYCLKCNEVRISQINPEQSNCDKCKEILIYKCITCGNKCSTHRRLYYHVRLKCPGFYRCTMCSYMTKTKNNLKKHIENIHGGDMNIQPNCKKCGKFFKNIVYLKKHINYCEKKVNHNCTFCNFKTKYPHVLKKHMDIIHSTEIKQGKKVNSQLRCDKCGKMFKHVKYQRRHYKICGTIADKKCQFCTFITKYSYSLKYHIEKQHPSGISHITQDEIIENEAYLNCQFCQYQTKYLQNLKEHMKKMHKSGKINDLQMSIQKIKNSNGFKSNRTSNTDCKKCGKKFQSSVNLNMHMKVCNSSKKED